MATVRSIATDALLEIGRLDPIDTLPPDLGTFLLGRFQRQLDSWQAQRLTLFNFTRTVYTLTSGTSVRTIGPATSGADITVAANPVYLDAINYIVPGSSPPVETPMGQMDANAFEALSIKSLDSSLPTQWFFNRGDDFGTLTFWPVVTQNVDLALYCYFGVPIPVTLNDTVKGPPGYAEAFMYQLAARLCAPFGINAGTTAQAKQNAMEAVALIKRTNTQPGLLGVDQALIPSNNAAYNVLTDQTSAPSNR